MKQTIKILSLLAVMMVTAGQAWADNVTYIDKNGDTQYCTEYTVLTGTETTLDAGWYFVGSDVTYSGNLITDGDGYVNIILCDGATLTASEISPIGHSDKLIIYGQSQGTGTANISGNIESSSYLAIYGGTINADGHIYCTTSGITISGGTVIADGIGSFEGDINISGGTVTVNGGISASKSDIILAGGTVRANFYNATPNYLTYGGKIIINDGLTYSDGTDTYSGTLYDNNTPDNGMFATLDDLNAALGGQTLTPVGFEVDGIIYEWTSETTVKVAKYKGNASSLTILANVNSYDVTEIGDDVFMDNTDLVSIAISHCPITTIGARAFKGCTSLSAITLPAALQSIGEEAFSGTDLEEITIPSYVTSIGSKAFADCANLATVTVCSGSVTALAEDAFEGCNANLIIYVPMDEYYNYCNRWPAYAAIIQPIGAIPYIAADGTKAFCTEYTVLSGNETVSNDGDIKLAAGWYVCNSNITYDHTLTLSGDVHLILADGCTMNVGSSESPISANGIECNSTVESLTIFGQTNGTGALSIYTDNGNKGIVAKDITINGGTVSVTATGQYSRGLYAKSNVTINGGTVNASGGADGILIDNGDGINGGAVTINGGTVNATGGYGSGINANYGECTITLGWTKPSDRITASSYSGTVKLASGKKLYDGSKFLDDTVSNPIDLDGKTLRPALHATYATADGTAETNAIVLDDTEAVSHTLAAGNYIATGTLNYTTGITLNGDVTLILADGCQMNVGSDGEGRINGMGIEGPDPDTGGFHDLTITSQSLGNNMGALSVYTKGSFGYGIRTGNLTINGGNITVDTKDNFSHALSANADITINGGTVTATVATGSKADAINAYGDFTYNGGNVTATGDGSGYAIKAVGNEAAGNHYTFSWRTPDDRITIGTTGLYAPNGAVVKTAEGKALKYTDGDNTVKLIGDIDATAIAGQTLTPYGIWGYCGTTENDADGKNLTWDIALKDNATSATDLATTMNIEGTGEMANYSSTDAPWKSQTYSLILVKDEAAYDSYKASLNATDKAKLAPQTLEMTTFEGWATYCHNYPVSYSLSNGATAHTVSGLNDAMTAITISDALDVVAPRTPLLINSSNAGDITLTAQSATATTLSSTDALVSTSVTGWAFYGNAGNEAFTTGQCDDIINPAGYTSYVLRNGKFIRVDENQGLAAHRCVLNVATQTGSAAPAMLTIGETTNIKTTDFTDYTDKADVWYSLDGRRIANGQKPTAKGIYIYKGKKVVVK